MKKPAYCEPFFIFPKTHLPKGIKVVINLGDMSDDDAFEEY